MFKSSQSKAANGNRYSTLSSDAGKGQSTFAFTIDEDDENEDFDGSASTDEQHQVHKLPRFEVKGGGDSNYRGWFKVLTFDWLKPLLETGNRKDQLDPEDLPQLFYEDESEVVEADFRNAWDVESRREPGKSPRLYRVLLRAFGIRFAKAGILKLIHDLCVFVGPNVLKALIIFLKSPDASMSTGLLLTFLVTASQLTMSLCLRQYFFQCYRTGLRLRSSLIQSIYSKSLTISSASRRSRTTGEIANLMSVDAQRMQDLTPYLHAVWYSFVQITLALTFLWRELGPSCLAGIFVIIVMMPVTKRVAKYLGGLQKSLMKVKDERLKVNNEVLSGVKVIKQMAWERSFTDKIARLRGDELSNLRSYVIGQALSGTLWSTVPLLVAVATFAAYVASGRILDVETALTSLALFEILRFPLFMLPQVINNLVEANVSLTRIESFLSSDDQEPVPKLPASEGSGIDLDAATFVWDGKRMKPKEHEDESDEELSPEEYENLLLRSQLMDAEERIRSLTDKPPLMSSAPSLLALKRVHLNVRPGDLVAIVGSVGSGKSTLLSGILGECRALSGSVAVSGRVAYAAQKSFIMNATLRDNVTFERTFNQSKYDRTVSACALTHDLTVLPGGDMTEIGEKGINLSGGQKARVSLARALYADADVYLLDDPLSAVDAHVGRHLFDKCILETMLNNPSRDVESAVVLVTNALQFLNHPRVSKILVVEGGTVVEEGTYQSLLSTDSLFNKLIKNYKDSSSESMSISRESSKADLSAMTDSEGTKVSDDAGSPKTSAKIRAPASPAKDNSKSKLMTDELKERSTGSVSRKMYFLYGRAAGGLHVVAVLLLGYAAVEAMTVGNRWWLSYWSEHGDKSQWMMLGIYTLINLTVVISMFLRQLFLYLSGLKAARKLYMELLESILRAPMSFFDTTPIGRILNRFSKDIYSLDQQLPSTIRAYLGTLSSVISTIMVITTVTPWFAVTLLPIIAYYIYNQRYFTKTYRELKRLDSVSRSPIYALFGETLEGVTTVRAFNAQGSLKKRLVKMLNENQTAFFLTFSAQCWLAVRLELAGTVIITFACLCAVLEHPFQASEAFAGAAGLSISFALSVTQSLNWSVRMSSDLEAQMVSVERVDQYIKGVTPEAPRETEGDHNLPRDFPKGEITFKDAEMRYRPGLPLVLKGLNLTIPAGCRVGVVGRTGAGKSSLMVVLLRLVELSRGKIYIDGVDIANLGLELIRSKIAIVPQDPVLFSGSIRTNLDPFGKFDDARLVRVLERVGLMGGGPGLESSGVERIKTLGDDVEEDGGNFSVGQRQLLVIARALLSECTIVLMDEATSSVDVDTDALIQKAMREEFGGATTITVAHRINTIMDSDMILVMDDGKSVEFDSPGSLLSKEEGYFKKLVEAFEESHG